MNKIEIINSIAAEHALTKVKAKEIVEQLFGLIGDELKKNGSFSFPNLGTFTVTQRAARQGRNPRTGESLKIKASKSIRFKASKSLKEKVAKYKFPKV